ncbi:MAG: methyltransferase [Acidobacteriota bacterium]
MSDANVTPQRIIQVSTGGWATAILATGAAYSIFTLVDGGVNTVEAIAKTASLSRRGTGALLDGLVGLGFLTVSDGVYANAPDAAAFLVEGRPTFFGAFPRYHYAAFPEWSHLPEVVKAGQPREMTAVAENPLWEQLVPAIAGLSMPVIHAAAAKLGIAKAGAISILDVGGGSGIYSAIWLGMNREARSTQIDWANVNRLARDFVGRSGAADRLRTVDGDFHDLDFGTAEHDVAVYSHIAHQESPSQNVAIFRKFRKALKPGGTLIVSDFVVADDRSGPPFALIFANEMLLHSKEGSTWRRADYRKWVLEAGFDKVAFEATDSPATLVYAS